MNKRWFTGKQIFSIKKLLILHSTHVMALSTTQLLESWNKRLREIQHSQYEAARPLSWMHYALGIPNVILATTVSSAIFSTLQKQQISEASKVVFGIISAFAAITAGLQTFLRFTERAEKHRLFAAKAGTLRRQIEQYLSSGNIASFSEEKIDKIRETYDQISSEAPTVSSYAWKRAKKKMAQL